MGTTSNGFLIAVGVSVCAIGCGGGSATDGTGGPVKQSLPPAANAQFSTVTAVWAFSDKDVWAVGSRVLHFDGSKWSEVPGPGAGVTLEALWGLAPDDLWATAGSKIYRYRGAAMGWVELVHGIPSPPDFSAIWVSAPDDFVVGGGDVNSEVVRVKGTTVSRTFTYGATTGIWGANASDIWAVSEEGGFWHWDGSAWSKVMPMGSGGNRPHSIWGFAANDVWAVGSEQTLQHWDGAAWTATSTTNSLGAVWGAGAHDVWAAGEEGALMHFDGTSWKESSADQGVFFTAMSGSGAHSVWASGYELSSAGNNGVVFRLQ